MSLPAPLLISETSHPPTRHNAAWQAGFRGAARLSAALLRAAAFPKARTALWHRLVNPHLAWRNIQLMSQTRYGAKMPCRAQDLIQRHIIFFGAWEPNIGHFIQARLRPGDSFVDVGANIGYFSMMGARCVGPTGTVFSIEASPAMFQLLEENLQRNGCQNVRATNIAAAEHPGTLDIYSGPPSNLGMTSTLSSRKYPLEASIPCARLSDILGRERCASIRLIKIDIEGAEWPVLKSILEDIILFCDELEIVAEISPDEITEFGISAAHVMDAFHAAGFHAYQIDNTYADYLKSRPPSRPRRIHNTPALCTDVVFSRMDAEFL